MFQKLFSCFNDSTENRQVDLSGAPLPAQGNSQFKPQLHPESNVEGKAIDFNQQMSETPHFSLNMTSLASPNVQNPATKRLQGTTGQYHQQQYMYQQDDGQLESKITTASPSKNQNYALIGTDQINSLQIQQSQQSLQKFDAPSNNNKYKERQMDSLGVCPQNQYQMCSQSKAHAQDPLVVDKRLNNYLQQAKLMVSGMAQNEMTPKKRPSNKLRNFSTDQKEKRLSCTQKFNQYTSQNSSDILFNAANNDNQSDDVSQQELSAELTNSMMQNSYRTKIAPNVQELAPIQATISNKQDANKLLNTKYKLNRVRSNNGSITRDDDKKGFFQKKGSKLQTQAFGYRPQKLVAQNQQNLVNYKQLTSIGGGSAAKLNKQKSKQQNNQVADRVIANQADAIHNNSQLQISQPLLQFQTKNLDSCDNDDEIGAGLSSRAGENSSKSSSAIQFTTDANNNMGYQKTMPFSQSILMTQNSTGSHKRWATNIENLLSTSSLIQNTHFLKETSIVAEKTPSKKGKMVKTSMTGSHKKTKSTLPQAVLGTPSRNVNFSKKHSTAVQSPIDKTTRVGINSASKQVSPNKSTFYTNEAPKGNRKSPGQKSNTKPKAIEIVEVLDENDDDVVCSNILNVKQCPQDDEEEKHKEQIVAPNVMSPSASSSFQYVPKFFKPTNLPQRSIERHSVSVDEQLKTTKWMIGSDKNTTLVGINFHSKDQ